MTTAYTINGNRIGTKTLSEFGLEPDMIREMSNDDIYAYFTAENLSVMFGAETTSLNSYDRSKLAAAAIELRDAE